MKILNNAHKIFIVVILTTIMTSCSQSDQPPSTSAAPETTNNLQQLNTQIAALEQRITRARDISEIKKLQRAYGYYLDRSDWDNILDMLTDDATAEYGPSGVYVGKESIRGIFYGIGYGASGLQPQQMREHIQLQPVINLSADGTTAQGRWRALVLLGQYNQYGRWQAGPYENEYRKENGVWKISKLHWAETFTVPTEGGWTTKMQAASNVADRKIPQADAPSTFSYDPWPAVSLLPYHYQNPASGPAQVPMAAPSANFENEEALSKQLARLKAQLQLLEDEKQIEILQRTYGYYVDKNLWSQIAELFTDDGTLEIGGRGVFVGKDRILEYLQFLGEPVDGRLYDHTQVQPIVHVSNDGLTAKGRWRALIFTGAHEVNSMFGDAVYENEYRKEGDTWKISKLYAYFIMYSDLSKGGWAKNVMENTRPEAELPPDRPPTVVYDMYPGELVAPLHYENLVTHADQYLPTPTAVTPIATVDIEATLADLNQRVGKIEDVQSIENLQSAYGYYVDKWRWDEAAEVFADGATSEQGLRGVYVGKKRIRESFNLSGEQGLHQGMVNNNIMYQPVIHVADDGNSANGRFRVMYMLGQYEGDGVIGGGVFENNYVKENGIWKIQKEHLYTTFLADLNKGWAFGPLPAPGPSDTLPPDQPPTVNYEIFPHFYTVPFHYNNPVTGKPPLE